MHQQLYHPYSQIQVGYLPPSSHPGHTRSHSMRWIISQARESSGSGGIWQGVTEIKCQAINKGGELYFQWRFIFSQPIYDLIGILSTGNALQYQWSIPSVVQTTAWCLFVSMYFAKSVFYLKFFSTRPSDKWLMKFTHPNGRFTCPKFQKLLCIVDTCFWWL